MKEIVDSWLTLVLVGLVAFILGVGTGGVTVRDEIISSCEALGAFKAKDKAYLCSAKL